MKAPVMQLLIILLGMAALTGCSSEGKANKVQDKPATAVDVLRLATVDIAEDIEVVGTLAAKYAADVKSEYQGRVGEILVDQWVPVTKGQALARLDTSEITTLVQKAAAAVEAAQAGLLQAQVMTQRAERERQRLLNLKDAGLVTRQTIDEAPPRRMPQGPWRRRPRPNWPWPGMTWPTPAPAWTRP